MSEYPDYSEDPDDERWKTDPAYWQAELDDHTAQYAEVERKRFAWLGEWQKEHTGDMMGEIEYVRMRLDAFFHQTYILGARLRLQELGCPEPHPVAFQ